MNSDLEDGEIQEELFVKRAFEEESEHFSSNSDDDDDDIRRQVLPVDGSDEEGLYLQVVRQEADLLGASRRLDGSLKDSLASVQSFEMVDCIPLSWLEKRPVKWTDRVLSRFELDFKDVEEEKVDIELPDFGDIQAWRNWFYSNVDGLPAKRSWILLISNSSQLVQLLSFHCKWMDEMVFDQRIHDNLMMLLAQLDQCLTARQVYVLRLLARKLIELAGRVLDDEDHQLELMYSVVVVIAFRFGQRDFIDDMNT